MSERNTKIIELQWQYIENKIKEANRLAIEILEKGISLLKEQYIGKRQG